MQSDSKRLVKRHYPISVSSRQRPQFLSSKPVLAYDTNSTRKPQSTTIAMDPESPSPTSKALPENGTTVDLVGAMSQVNLDHEQNTDTPLDHESIKPPPRPLHIYTRADMLKIHQSPLVKPPEGMPALKDWFG